ncbi:hypothetical protein [Parasphaerochaeta coccoides]|uniref:Uncharacterized protein n=1 Tax=Parasphaerochaeta coccoides (strain ATCC BAA-1237 / DSM 17374 / SPN1) TaxID=760011 RepID=F4GJB1_PARC1|nr:hypothetical protein [Parasphaerochaeta coccoides]AEC01751.1 hypothetical protein Spico_0523 [Parasphaerochaeta coccoides DSM 17374]
MKTRRAGKQGAMTSAAFLTALFLMLVLSMMTLLLSGCVHTSPFSKGEEFYFQALGDADHVVATMDVPATRDLLASSSLASSRLGSGSADVLLDKAERLSVTFSRMETSDDWDYRGAFEGDYSRFLLNMALKSQNDLTRNKVDGVTWFEDASGMQFGVPKNGIVLFSTKDWESHYQNTLVSRSLTIPADIARNMAAADIGIYLNAPRSVPLFIFDVPAALLMQTSEAYFTITLADDGTGALDGVVRMHDPRLANSLSMLVRSQHITTLRRDGQKIDIPSLQGMFTPEGDVLVIRDYPLSSTQVRGVLTGFGF